ncbi:MAG: VWA domain-containing protein [Planctomycetota bacterium]
MLAKSLTLVVLAASLTAQAGGLDRQRQNELKQTLRQSLLANKLDAAVAAIAELATGDDKACALVLLGLAHNSPPRVWDAARDGLASMSSPEVDMLLSRKCTRARPEEQLLVADALRVRGGSFAELSLVQLLESQDPRIVRAALVALQRAELTGARGAVEGWLSGAGAEHPARLLGQRVLHVLSGGEAGEAAPGPSCAGQPLLGGEVVFVLDASQAMAQDGRFARAKQAILDAIATLSPEQRFTVLAYAGKVREGLAEPELEKGRYPLAIEGTPWLWSLGPRVEFAKGLWLDKARAWLDGLTLAETDEAFALRAVEAALDVPLVDTVVLISSGRFSDVDHGAGARYPGEALPGAVQAANRMKRAVIDVRCFPGGDPALERLATESGGTFAPLE